MQATSVSRLRESLSLCQCIWNCANRNSRCIVTDEAANFKLARAIICGGRKGMLEYRCLAHVFNLMIESMCDYSNIKQHVVTLSELISKISKNKMLISALRQRQTRKLVGVVPTRWYSLATVTNVILDIRED